MPRRRKPVDVTGMYHELDDLRPPLDWAGFFGNDRPVQVEIGPGKGVFLAHAGGVLPGTNFVGVERAKKYAVVSAERVVKAGLENVRVVSGDGQEFLDRFVPEGSVEVLHVYFPDPWWKSRHRKRRVVNERFLDRASKVVRPGGELRVLTDVEEYFLDIADLLAARPCFRPIAAGGADEDILFRAETNFAIKYRVEGRPFFGGRYRVEPRAETVPNQGSSG